jgi:hypothetical protein
VSVRLSRRGTLSLHGGARRTLSSARLRTFARSHRPARGSAASAAGGAGGSAAG